MHGLGNETQFHLSSGAELFRHEHGSKCWELLGMQVNIL